MARPAISDDQRRARVQQRHQLDRRTPGSVADLTRELMALHATDPATVLLSLVARLDGFSVADAESALYDERTVVRMLAMRRTVWVVPVEDVATFDAGATAAVAATERRKLEKLVADHVPDVDPAVWLIPIARKVLARLDDVGEASASELRHAVPELGTTFVVSRGKPYESTVGLTSKLLFQLAAEGHLVRGRPLGTWLSTQYRWARTEAWLGGPLVREDPAAARVGLARRWLRVFGPGTVEDLAWWMGWRMGETRTALAATDAVEVDLDRGAVGWVLAGDEDPVPVPPPTASLLPGLDPTAMGWKGRDWQYGDHRGRLFDRNGNAGPTVWWDGRAVGGWVQRPDGAIRVALLEDVGAEAEAVVAAEAERLQEWLGEVRVTARFPSPLTKELLAG